MAPSITRTDEGPKGGLRRGSSLVSMLAIMGMSLSGCSDATSDLSTPLDVGSVADMDGGSSTPTATCSWPDGGGEVALGMWGAAPSGCHDCLCGPPLTQAACNKDCVLQCPQGACPTPLTDDIRCQSQSDCNHDPAQPWTNICVFNMGCEPAAGRCVRTQSRCSTQPLAPAGPDDEVVFCGCDGVTYPGDCAPIPYAHAGRCGTQ